MDLTLRALSHDDIPAWARLLADIEKVDRTGEHYSPADLEEEMANPDIELGKDIVGGFEGDTLVGYFAVYSRGEAEGFFKVHGEGSVHPDRRGEGIGTKLVEAMVSRAEAVRAEKSGGSPGKLMCTGLTSNTAQEALLADAGMHAQRWNFQMRTSLDDVPPPPPLPSGYELRQYDASMADAMRAAHNVAFLDHPNFSQWSEAAWKQWVTESRNFRPDLSRTVVPVGSDEIVAYVQTNEFDATFEATGIREAYVGKLGTLREHRGKGIAAALLGHCLAAYQQAGYDESALDVDSQNPTGALGVYERAGFAVESRWANYVKVIG